MLTASEKLVQSVRGCWGVRMLRIPLLIDTIFLTTSPYTDPVKQNLSSPIIPIILLLGRWTSSSPSFPHTHRTGADGAARLLLLLRQTGEVIPKVLAALVKRHVSPVRTVVALDEAIEAVLGGFAGQLGLFGELGGCELGLLGEFAFCDLLEVGKCQIYLGQGRGK